MKSLFKGVGLIALVLIVGVIFFWQYVLYGVILFVIARRILCGSKQQRIMRKQAKKYRKSGGDSYWAGYNDGANRERY